MTETEKVVSGMLKTSTGVHFLDSGGAYGRHWERNQRRNFVKEPEVSLEVCALKGTDKEGRPYEVVEISTNINVYHFLVNAVEYAPVLDKELQRFLRRKEFEDDGYLECAQAYAESKGWKSIQTFNTYNGDSFLSQVVQGVVTDEGDGGYVLLQIHQGCDVRGGYTKPVAFYWSMNRHPSLFDYARATVYCIKRNKGIRDIHAYTHAWDIEPGYSQGLNNEASLDTFPTHVLAKEESPQVGKLCAREDEVFCPLCTNKLEAGF